MTYIKNATIGQIIDSAAHFYGIDPLYALAVSYADSEMNPSSLYDLAGRGLDAETNPITNAHLAIATLKDGDKLHPEVSDDIYKAIQAGLYPPGWDERVNFATPLSLQIGGPDEDTPTTTHYVPPVAGEYEMSASQSLEEDVNDLAEFLTTHARTIAAFIVNLAESES